MLGVRFSGLAAPACQLITCVQRFSGLAAPARQLMHVCV